MPMCMKYIDAFLLIDVIKPEPCSFSLMWVINQFRYWKIEWDLNMKSNEHDIAYIFPFFFSDLKGFFLVNFHLILWLFGYIFEWKRNWFLFLIWIMLCLCLCGVTTLQNLVNESSWTWKKIRMKGNGLSEIFLMFFGHYIQTLLFSENWMSLDLTQLHNDKSGFI